MIKFDKLNYCERLKRSSAKFNSREKKFFGTRENRFSRNVYMAELEKQFSQKTLFAKVSNVGCDIITVF